MGSLSNQTIANQALCEAFLNALLLTGSMEGAESAVLAGIMSMNGGDLSSEALSQEVIASGIHSNRGGNRTVDLPKELLNVLRLPQQLRRVFVLRVLVGLSREACARMLRTRIETIDELTCASACALAGIAKPKDEDDHYPAWSEWTQAAAIG